MKKPHIQRRVLWSWLASYITIMIIPLLFGTSIYLFAISNVRDEIQTIQHQAIVQVKYNLENMLDNLYKVSYALSSSAYKAGIYVQREDDSAYNPISVAQVQKTMGSYKIANNNIQSMHMYFPENDYLLSETITYKYQRLHEYSQKFLNLSNEQFDSFQNVIGGRLLLIHEDSGKNQLYYVYQGRGFQGKIIVFVGLNMDLFAQSMQIKISDASKQWSVDNGTGVYLRIAGEILWLGGMQETVPHEFIENTDSHSYHTAKAGMTSWIAMPVDNANDVLITCMDGNIYFEKVRHMQWLLFSYLILSFILCGFVSWKFTRRHYMPVEQLMAGVEPGFKNGDSEYKIITDYYASVKEQYQHSRNELKENQLDIKNSRLARLLTSDKYAPEMLQKMNGQIFESGTYILAGILISAESQEDYHTDCFIVENIITEVLEKKYTVISGEVDGFLVYLIHFDETYTEIEVLIQNLEYALYYIDQFYHIPLVINLSRKSEDIKKISSAFDEIKAVQEYRDWLPKDEIKIRQAQALYFSDEGNTESIGHYHKYTKMLQYMKNGEYEKVNQILQSLLCQDDVNNKTFRVSTRKDRMINEITTYIDEHYDDWQLSGKMFADRYQVSLSYLSQIFKKEKGIGLLDYINQIRYTKAKAMIENGATIQEAASRAGYSTTQPLRRLFRQFEGITPSQSRKKKQPENDA